MDERRIEACMKCLGLTREEVIEMIKEDASIERGFM